MFARYYNLLLKEPSDKSPEGTEEADFRSETGCIFLLFYKFDENGFSIRDHAVKNDVPFLESYKLDTFTSVKAFTIAGLGIGILPERLAKDDLDAGLLKKIAIKGFSTRGFGRHRICFSLTSTGKSDLRIKLLQQELKKYLALQNS